ncbi:MAG: YbjP/YqhG family protein [Azoarcus sp.]|nr:YbjP/YqhG family protein [Azoarcus sp.]
MPNRRNLVCFMVALALADPPAAFATPPAPASSHEAIAMVEAIYARAVKGKDGGDFVTANKAARAKYLSRSLAALWDKSDSLVEEGDIGAIEFDPVTNSQDPDIKSFKVTPEKIEADKADIAVALISRHTPGSRVVRYALVHEAGGWKIDDIKGFIGKDPWSVRGLLTDFIKLMEKENQKKH